MNITKGNTYGIDVPSPAEMRNITEQNQFFKAQAELQEVVNKIRESDEYKATFPHLSIDIQTILSNKGYNVGYVTDQNRHILYFEVSWEDGKEALNG